MTEIIGTLVPLPFSIDGQDCLCIKTKSDCKALYESLTDKQLRITVKAYREKRSLNANAYCWLLVGKIADVLRASKDEIYVYMLKRYGQSEMISVQAHIPVSGYIKYFDEAGESTLNGKLFKHYKVYKGSSEFDSKEMAILIDGIVSEAKGLNIETMTPAELAVIKSNWRTE